MAQERTAPSMPAIDAQIQNLTLDEKCLVISGASSWLTHGAPRLGIPPLKMSDGPNGVRGEARGARATPSVSVPVGIALGATWDPDLIGEIGALLGREAVRKGAHVLLAPTVNLQRTPVGGRVFECMSEDPELSAGLATRYVQGVQASDVAVTVKHFVANDTEIDRMSVNARVPERALHELYLRPFEAAVRDGGAWGVMSAYNQLEGEHCAQNRHLLTEILREEWGFDGFVVSDWLGAHATVEAAHAGLNVPMPGPRTIYGERLAEQVRAGAVDEAVVDALVRDVLVLVDRTRAAERTVDRPEESVDDPAERALCRRAAAAGMVLLRNNGALPLEATALKTVALIGPNAAEVRTMGGGSSSLRSLPTRKLPEALADRLPATVTLQPGVRIDKMTPIADESVLRDPDGRPGLRLEYVNGTDPDGPVVLTDTAERTNITFFGSTPDGVDHRRFHVRLTGTYVPEADGPLELGLVVTGPARWLVNGETVLEDPTGALPRSEAFYGFGSEEQMHTVTATAGVPVELAVTMTAAMGFGALRLGIRATDPPDLLEQAVRDAQAADVALVIVGTNDEWETEGHDRESIALPGEQDELVRRVAAVNNNTVVVVNAGSPVAMPWIDDVAAVLVASFGGMEMADALVDVLTGVSDPGGRLPITYPLHLEDTPAWPHYRPVDGVQHYGEGLLMGYRGFEAANVTPLFPFGHGLSYGDVEWGEPEVSTTEVAAGASVTVRVPLRNVGDRPATAVVQGYVAPLDPPVLRAPKELRAWQKVALEAGASGTATFELTPHAFRRWDDTTHAWVVDPGAYELVIAASATDERARVKLSVR